MGGPTNIKKYGNAPIIVNATSNEFYKQPLYYAIGHFSKLIPPGSVHVGAKDNIKNVDIAVFKRPDNGTVITVLNR